MSSPLFPPLFPTDGPHVVDLPSTSSRLGGLQQADLISCSAALQMPPGTKTEDGDTLMIMMRVGDRPATCADLLIYEKRLRSSKA